ncbi:MAG: lytic transglycosylase domain-containing protein, partial [Candidatus Dadabacteria bacterium]|nr:lytic transglycosylase domain-containing protein [Candidatus Dadabacteria bacterium]
GLMQLIPETAARFGVTDVFDPKANIYGGTQYLGWLMTYFKGDLELVLAAYNAGEHAVEKYNYQIPPYKETINYVKKVFKFFDYYKSRPLSL